MSSSKFVFVTLPNGKVKKVLKSTLTKASAKPIPEEPCKVPGCTNLRAREGGRRKRTYSMCWMHQRRYWSKKQAESRKRKDSIVSSN